MDWDDLRIIAAIRDNGTFARASSQLRIDETTVARRLARLQEQIGVTLFSAVDGVRKPTPECETILDHVQKIEQHVAEISVVGSTTPKVTGRIRIATINAVAADILAPQTAEFLLRNPGLFLEYRTSNENVNFSRWEADLAIRLLKPKKGNFSISKLGSVRLYFFEPKNVHHEPVICGYPDYLGYDQTAEGRFLASRGLEARARCTTDNYRVIRGLIKSHAAMGILPEYLCGTLLSDRGLQATLLPERRDMWLLVQNHLKRNGPARVVIDWIRGVFSQLGGE